MTDAEDDPDLPMRAQILSICVEALRREGLAEATAASVLSEPRHARRMLVLLRDCRPLPVVLGLIAEAEAVANSPPA